MDDQVNRDDINAYCVNAGIDLDLIKKGVNNVSSTIPPELLSNGCILAILKTHPPWPLLTSWLSMWMGERFPPATPPSRVRYFAQKIQQKRVRLLRTTTPKYRAELHALEQSPFVLPPVKNTMCPVTPPISSSSAANFTSAPFYTSTSESTRPSFVLSTPILSSTSCTPAQILPPQPVFILPKPVLSSSIPSTSSHKASVLPSPLSSSPAYVLPSSPSTSSHASVLSSPLLPSISHPPSRSSQFPSNTDFMEVKKKLRLTTLREKRKEKRINILKTNLKRMSRSVQRIIKLKDRQKQQHKVRMTRLCNQRKTILNKSTQVKMDCSQCLAYEKDFELLTNEEQKQHILKTVSFFNNGKYDDSFIECVLSLLDLNIANHNVSTVIQTVLKLVQIQPDRLPCRATVENIGKLRRPLCDMNIVETLKNTQSTTLYSDGTSKYGRQLETFVLTDDGHTPKLLGIHELPDKSSATCFNSFKDLIENLNILAAGDGSKILANIRNTMSDRAANEKRFEELLQTYRKDILPQAITNWSSMDSLSQRKLSTTHNFFCGLHLLVNCAERVGKTLHSLEDNYAKTEGHHTDCSVINFIRTSCKAFSRGGDEKSGYFSQVSSFLAGRGVHGLLTPFRGNRFNILFHNAAVIYHLHHHFKDFISDYIGTPNLLIATVQEGLSSEFIIAGCRALGLLDKFLTKPLWQKLEEEGSILRMNGIYNILINTLHSINVHSLLDGSAILIPDTQPNDGSAAFNSLITPADTDVLTESILSVLLPDLAILLQKLLTDQLPGGKHFEKTEETNPECASVLKHNKLPETVFGQLDFNQHRKPSALLYTHESTIMYHFNKVGEWLDSMTQEEMEEKLHCASLLRHKYFNNFKEQQIRIREAKAAEVERLREAAARKKSRITQEKINYTNDMVVHGLWQSREEVEERLQTYLTNSKRSEALKIQLRFRRHVLKQAVSDKTLFSFSEKGKGHSVKKLTANLQQIIEEAGSPCDNSALSGKRILHTFEEEGGRLQEYQGRVISQVPGFPAWFNVVYTSEPETVYTYQLQEDLAAGDLKVLSDN